MKPAAPTITMTVHGSALTPGYVFRGGTAVIAASVVDPTHYWQRWNGAGWNSELIPWPTGFAPAYIEKVVALPNGNTIIVTDTWYLLTFDGTHLANPIKLPDTGQGQHYYGISADAAGAYHVMWGDREWTEKSDGTWYPPAPLPFSLTSGLDDQAGAAAIMRDGREVLVYTALVGSVHHLFLASHTPGNAWSAPVDFTPQWAVDAHAPSVYAPPGGGLAIYATGQSDHYSTGNLWRSANGIDVGDYTEVWSDAISGGCLDDLIVNTYDSSGHAVLARIEGTSSEAMGAPDPNTTPYTTYYPASVVALASGKTFWVVPIYNGLDYQVTP